MENIILILLLIMFLILVAQPVFVTLVVIGEWVSYLIHYVLRMSANTQRNNRLRHSKYMLLCHLDMMYQNQKKLLDQMKTCIEKGEATDDPVKKAKFVKLSNRLNRVLEVTTTHINKLEENLKPLEFIR